MKSHAFGVAAAGMHAVLALTAVGGAEPSLMREPQKFGTGQYLYRATENGRVFVGMEAAQRPSAARPPLPSGLLSHLWGTHGLAWDGRVIPNELAASPPTLNLLPDPFNPANESGSKEPARELNQPGVPDPLDGPHTLGLSFSAGNQQLFFTQSEGEATRGPWATPQGVPLRLRLWAKTLEGPSTFTLGQTSHRIEVTPEWKEYATDLTLEAPAALAFGSSAPGRAAIAGAALYDPAAGDVLPSLAQLLDDQNGAHGSMALRLPGTIVLTPEGAVDNRRMGAGVRIFTGPSLPETPAYTIGVWVSPDQIKDPSYGTAITIGDHLDGTAKYHHGMLGIYSDANADIDKRGRLRPFPTNNVGAKRTGQYLLGQGWQHLALTVREGVTTPYINGIPLYEAFQETWKTPRFHTLTVGYYMPNLRRQNSNRYLPCLWQGAYVARRALSDAEILQIDRHGRARLREDGLTPAPRRAVFFGMGGGALIPPESWWWRLCENYGFTPRLHAHLEGRTGGNLQAWMADDRLEFARRQIVAAADSYDAVWCVLPTGDSDESLWLSAGVPAYREQFSAYVQKLRSLHPKVRIAVATALPRAQEGRGIKGELARQEWNDLLRDGASVPGIDALWDVGLGTERIDASGTVREEPVSGGSLMGNWRVARASLTHRRAPDCPARLAPAEKDRWQAEAATGTFGPDDVFRCVVTPSGRGRIVAVSPDGSRAELETAGFRPVSAPGEPGDQIARDTVENFSLAAGDFPPGAWTVEQDESFYRKGITPTYPGGRLIGDRIAGRVRTAAGEAR